MNKPPNSNQTPIQFILRAQLLAQQDTRSERGYAMVIVSIVSVMMFSMLAACLAVTNLSKSSTNVYVDGTNSFYVAESGLNKLTITENTMVVTLSKIALTVLYLVVGKNYQDH